MGQVNSVIGCRSGRVRQYGGHKSGDETQLSADNGHLDSAKALPQWPLQTLVLGLLLLDWPVSRSLIFLPDSQNIRSHGSSSHATLRSAAATFLPPNSRLQQKNLDAEFQLPLI